MFRVIHRMFVLVNLGLALAVITVGLISFYRPIPGDLWISAFRLEPRLQWAFVDGTLHIVQSRPAKRPPPQSKEKRLAGFSVKTQTVGLTVASGVGIPFWVVAIGLSIYPLLALISGPFRRRRRRRRGICPDCGYSLRGLPEPRCPECGRAYDPHHITVPPAA